jgi:hypothetical protein
MKQIPLGALIEVEEVGFFDMMHGQSGVAKNGFEIHPILKNYAGTSGCDRSGSASRGVLRFCLELERQLTVALDTAGRAEQSFLQ